MSPDRCPFRAGRARGRGPRRPAPLRWAAAAAALAAALVLSAGGAGAQGVWTAPGSGGAVWLEVVKAEGTDGDSPFLSSAWYLGGRLPLGETTALVGELPVGIAGKQEITVRGRTLTLDADAALGNPYVGLALATESPLSWELGLRLPVAGGSSRAIGVGGTADPVDRLEAWVAGDFVPLVGTADYVVRSPSGLLARARGGSTVWIPAGGGDMEMTLQYGGQVGWEGADVRALGGLTGRFVVTGPGGLADRSLHELGGGVRLLLGRIEPGVQLRVPLDEELADLVFGASVAIRVP